MAEAMFEGYHKFDRTLKLSKPFLVKLDRDPKMEILRLLLKKYPSFDETDVINRCILELQKQSQKAQKRVTTSVCNSAAAADDDDDDGKSSVTTASRDHIFEAVGKKFEGPIICRFKLPHKPAPITVENNKLQKSGKLGSKRPSSDGFYCDVGDRDLPIKFKERIAILNGSDAVLVIEKRLFNTDVSTSHSRFSIPMNQVMNEFLRPEEEAMLSKGTGKIKARIIGAKGKKRKICITKWGMKKTQVYNLVQGWNRFAKRNKLRKDKAVQLWAFRVRSKLWFALVKVKN